MGNAHIQYWPKHYVNNHVVLSRNHVGASDVAFGGFDLLCMTQFDMLGIDDMTILGGGWRILQD